MTPDDSRRTVDPATTGGEAPASPRTLEPPAAPDAAPDRGLDGQFARGLAWTGAAKWGSQIVTWTSTLLVARLLTPEDYGLVAMAGVYLGVVKLLSEFGVGASVIMMRDLDRRQVAELNGLSLVLGVVGLLLSVLVAWPLGAFFDAPQLPAVVLAMSTTFVITAFRVVPGSLVNKQLRFKELAFVDALRAIIMAGSMVVLALLGFRYWTLVLGAILSAVAETALVLRLQTHPIAFPRLANIRSAVRFSADVVGSRLLGYFYSTSDFLVAGKLLGKGPLGAYRIAWDIASMPIEKITSLVMQVTPAVFAAVQTQPAAIRRYVLTLTEGLALITFPAAVGAALVAEDFVLLLLGSKYAGAVVPLQLLAIYAAIRSLAPLFPPVLTALGDTRFVLWNNALAFLLLPPAFIFGARWGTAGIAAAWILIHPIILALLWRRVARSIDMRARDQLKALWPAIVGSLVMAGLVLAVRTALPPDMARSWHLGLQIATGAAAYAVVCLTVFRSRIDRFLRLTRSLRSDRKSAAATT